MTSSDSASYTGAGARGRGHCQDNDPGGERNGSEAESHRGRNVVAVSDRSGADESPAAVALASAPIPTAFGQFDMHVFRGVSTTAGDLADHVALTMGALRGRRGVLLRMHSECMTSEVFGSLKCDCRDQLAMAQQQIASAGAGLIVYLRQEGRGIGLTQKLRAYALQAKGVDTVDANRELGLPDDTRCYDVVASVLQHFGVQSVRLLTNNPEKLQALVALGVTVDAVVPVIAEQNPHSAGYLDAKRARMGHWLPGRRLPSSRGHVVKPFPGAEGAGRA